MKVKLNKIIAIALAVAMVVIGINYTPKQNVKADDEYTEVTDTWVTVGNFQIFKGYEGRTMSYSGTGAYNDMKVKMMGTPSGADWTTQIGINLSGLEEGITYNYEIVFDSNNATTIFDQVPGSNGVTTNNDISVVAGENTISGTFVAGTNPAHGNIMLFPKSASAGTIFDFKSVTVTEVETPTVAADWVAVPASNNQY